MAASRLHRRLVERVWGERELPDWTGAAADLAAPVGEIWFEDEGGGDTQLLVKYLFTRERLSIQVHPDDAMARALGHKSGKSEAWLVLAAEAGAVIGLGLIRETDKAALRAAAESGAIENLIDWRPVAAGDFFFAPAGTVHAIGAGLTLIEIQQNLDLTYRLYDYSRPRELHLEAGVAAADPRPWRAMPPVPSPGDGREVLHAGAAFVVERWRGGGARRMDWPELLLIPTAAGASIDGQACAPGEVWRVTGEARVALEAGGELLAAYPGERPRALSAG